MKAIRPATEVLVALAVLAILIVGGIAASKILPGDEPKRAAVGAAVDGSDRHLYQLADKGSASVTGVSDRQLYQQAKKTLTGVAQAPDRQLYQLMKHGTSGSQPVLNVQQIEEARWAAYAKEAQRLNGTAVEGSDRHLYQLAEQVRTSGGQPVLNVQQIEEARWAAYAKEAQRLNATAVEGSDRHLYQLAEQVRTSGEPSLTAKQIEDARWAEYVKSAQEAWSDGPRSPCIRHCFAHR
jgi:acylphosphatase